MNAMDRKKMEQVKGLSTEALERIVSSLRGPEVEGPLAGMVHITGIGQVPIRVLRNVLRDRRAAS